VGPHESAIAASDKIADLASSIAFPWILKPAYEGSSKGIRSRCLVDSAAEALDVYQGLAVDYEQPILLEEFIDGDEVTVGLIGNPGDFALVEAMRVVPTRSEGRFVYSIELKRDWSENVRYESPAQLGAELRERVFASATEAFIALGCQDVARIDYRIRHGTPYFIEANPLPGLAPDWSDLVILGKGAGLQYGDLVRMILHAAVQRVGPRESVLGGCRL
jgi:D-alanine-D-alanine ligase